MQVFYRTFSGETGGRVGGGGQVSARSDLSGPGRGFGNGGGGDRVEQRGVSDIAHLVLRLQHETSGQEERAGERTGVADPNAPHLGSCCPPSPAGDGRSRWNICKDEKYRNV